MISESDTDKYLAEILEILRERFDNGDKSALLYAMWEPRTILAFSDFCLG